jgi:hypothetical protein
MKTAFLKILCFLIIGLLLLPTSSGSGLDDWEKGDEEEILGESFEDEFWTAEVSNSTENGTATFVVSYVNYEDVQAFLVAFKSVGNDTASGTLPWQMYGMHYFTPDGNEVFIGALLAFLMVYNDTNDNGIPNPDAPHNEDIFYVIPFGVGDTLEGQDSYAPVVTPIQAKELSEGHYQFGMKYQNMYAYVSRNPIMGAILRTGWIAKFSELTITYDITIDKDSGEVKTETYYTIGQVTELWGLLLGIPFQADPADLPASLGISAVHFVTIFTSNYQITGETSGKTISPTKTELADENITIAVGNKNERAFAIRFMGQFDLKDETTGNYTKTNKTAYNILLQAKFNDLILVAWQLEFSAAIFSIFAYALSDYVQEEYDSPRDLAQKSLIPWNPKGFGVRALWYAVCFPSWEGYRVEHDPVYIGYIKDASAEEESGPCGAGALVFVGAICVPSATVFSRKKRNKGT